MTAPYKARYTIEIEVAEHINANALEKAITTAIEHHPHLEAHAVFVLDVSRKYLTNLLATYHPSKGQGQS